MYNLTSDKFATLTSVKKVQNMIRTISTGLGALCLPFRSFEPHQVVFVAVYCNNYGSSNMRRLIKCEFYLSLIRPLYESEK